MSAEPPHFIVILRCSVCGGTAPECGHPTVAVKSDGVYVWDDQAEETLPRPSPPGKPHVP